MVLLRLLKSVARALFESATYRYPNVLPTNTSWLLPKIDSPAPVGAQFYSRQEKLSASTRLCLIKQESS